MTWLGKFGVLKRWEVVTYEDSSVCSFIWKATMHFAWICKLYVLHKQLTLISNLQASRVLSSSSSQGGPHWVSLFWSLSYSNKDFKITSWTEGHFAGVRQTQTADLQTADLQTCRLADLQTYRHVWNSRGKGVIDQYLGIGDRGDQWAAEGLKRWPYLFRTKNILKNIPCWGQHPQF